MPLSPSSEPIAAGREPDLPPASSWQRWRKAAGIYANRRILIVLALSFSSGLPLLLTYSTLSGWLAKEGISRTSIGLFALVGTPYALKFLWSPIIDRVAPPLPLGQRRGWGILIQLGLMAAIFALGSMDPHREIGLMAGLAVLVAFLSASQDIVIDAYRIELLQPEEQGPGAGITQAGYRIGILAAGAGALHLAQSYGWSVSYGIMAALMAVGILVFLFSPEPSHRASPESALRERQAAEFLAARPHLEGVRGRLLAFLFGAVVCPFADFMGRRQWAVILLFVLSYKVGEAMAGYMAMPLFVQLGFTLDEIAAVSKIFGVFATVLGGLAGGIVVARLGPMPALLLCGALQSLGNLFYILQVWGGHDVAYLIFCIAAENLTGGMAGAALIAYLSGLCNAPYTATQYALLSSFMALGRTVFASAGGALAEHLGWERFFLLTTAATLPSLLLLVYLMRTGGEAGPRRRG